MSKENRQKEYDRLISLGRTKDIPESLTSEFGEKLISNPNKIPPRSNPPNSTKKMKVKNGK